jgi:hypothetical protein
MLRPIALSGSYFRTYRIRRLCMVQPIDRFFMYLIPLFSMWIFSLPAHAECSDSRVKRLAKEGKTIAAIARSCDMSKEEVQVILGDDDDNNSKSEKLPSGTAVGQCGCWGYVDPQLRQPTPQCESGYARPVPCPFGCQMGGYAWRGVCE